MADYMDKTTEQIDGKPLLEGILKIQGKATVAMDKKASTPALAKLKGRHSHGSLGSGGNFG